MRGSNHTQASPLTYLLARLHQRFPQVQIAVHKRINAENIDEQARAPLGHACGFASVHHTQDPTVLRHEHGSASRCKKVDSLMGAPFAVAVGEHGLTHAADLGSVYGPAQSGRWWLWNRDRTRRRPGANRRNHPCTRRFWVCPLITDFKISTVETITAAHGRTPSTPCFTERLFACSVSAHLEPSCAPQSGQPKVSLATARLRYLFGKRALGRRW